MGASTSAAAVDDWVGGDRVGDTRTAETTRTTVGGRVAGSACSDTTRADSRVAPRPSGGIDRAPQRSGSIGAEARSVARTAVAHHDFIRALEP